MGIYKEKSLPPGVSTVLLLLTFFAVFQPWNLDLKELTKLEGLFAAEVLDLSLKNGSVVSAHGAVILNAFPLYPLFVKAVHCITEIPMEAALRLVSLFMLGMTAVLVYFAAASNRTGRAGVVAAAMYIGSILVIDKGIDGNPTTTTALAVLGAHLLLFQFGFRRSNWSLAWVLALVVMTLGFFSGGFLALLYFVFPIFFFRRPLSVRSKFTKPGFWIGLLFLAGAIAHWGVASWDMTHKVPLQMTWWGQERFWDYLKTVLQFPFELPIRLLPWSLIAWLPFCVALQALDKTPIFSRFLRTLTFSNLALIWLLPRSDARDIIYILGPLSILTGITYDIGMRRYGRKIRRWLLPGEWSLLLLAAAVGILCFCPVRYIELFASVSNSIDFSRTMPYLYLACGVISLLLFGYLLIHWGKHTLPVWLMLLVLSCGYGLFFQTVLQHYRAQEEKSRNIGRNIREALKDERVTVLYKYNIVGMYSELYYSGQQVIQLENISELPQQEPVVYLLSREFPSVPNREWSNLLPDNGSTSLMLWKGVSRPTL
ncbi:MAG: glycosyltransferase family 39 protein [Lentisphaeria bacterium]|nr:glycosyltransferase family 39 protein [Lentisphaeria bacterium]